MASPSRSRVSQQIQYTQITRCMLSLISGVGTALSESGYTAAGNLLNLTTKDLVEAARNAAKGTVPMVRNVDLGSFQVASDIFSEKVVVNLGTPARSAVEDAVRGCVQNTENVQNLSALEAFLPQSLDENGQLDSAAALVDIGSPEWKLSKMRAPLGQPIGKENGIDEKERKYFQMIIHESKTGVIGVPRAIDVLNNLLRRSNGLREIYDDQLEEWSIHEANGDDQVTDQILIAVYRAVRLEQMGKQYIYKKLLDEATKRFRLRAKPGTTYLSWKEQFFYGRW